MHSCSPTTINRYNYHHCPHSDYKSSFVASRHSCSPTTIHRYNYHHCPTPITFNSLSQVSLHTGIPLPIVSSVPSHSNVLVDTIRSEIASALAGLLPQNPITVILWSHRHRASLQCHDTTWYLMLPRFFLLSLHNNILLVMPQIIRTCLLSRHPFLKRFGVVSLLILTVYYLIMSRVNRTTYLQCRWTSLTRQLALEF